MNPWPERNVTAAYLHIPFCVRKCLYCDFVSFAGVNQTRQLEYTDQLAAEIDRIADQVSSGVLPLDAAPLQTVFFGGGTPSFLPAKRLAGLLDRLTGRFSLAADAEVTLEANPGTTTPEGLAVCHQAGFNRISFGLQSASPLLLKTLGRIHDAADFQSSVQMAVAAGFERISADIMFGLPDQSEKDIEDTLQLIFSLPINHVSFYGLILEEGTPLFDAYHHRPARIHLPDDEQERSQYHLIRRRLAENGFAHYEISNSARPGEQCRHNLVYWHGLPYYGFGVAAHSYLAGLRRANPATLEAYAGTWQPEVLEQVSRDEGMKEMLLLGLRLVNGVAVNDFYRRFGVTLDERFRLEIDSLQARGLLIVDQERIRLSETGLDLANQVFQEFI